MEKEQLLPGFVNFRRRGARQRPAGNNRQRAPAATGGFSVFENTLNILLAPSYLPFAIIKTPPPDRADSIIFTCTTRIGTFP